eukprot:scaffold3073_cov66-Cylindrotheca_fusiformis.AAC.18
MVPSPTPPTMMMMMIQKQNQQSRTTTSMTTTLIMMMPMTNDPCDDNEKEEEDTESSSSSSSPCSLSSSSGMENATPSDNNNNKTESEFSSSSSFSWSFSRRNWLIQSARTTAAAVATTTTTLLAFPPIIATATAASTSTSTNNEVTNKKELIQSSFGASWTAVDGLNSIKDTTNGSAGNDNNNNNKNFVGFDTNAYKAMRDDTSRTPIFTTAIQERLAKYPTDTQVVLDLGTGPFCLFGLIAAQLGAKQVYAIEANSEAAASARAVIQNAGYSDIVTILEGYSTDITLPEKVDFCIAEIVGSIASEEGAYGTITDAAHRFVKNPTLQDNWIPCRIQTYGAPASYTLHNLFGPPEFDWNKLNGEPVRFSCRDYGLELLSDPQLMEDISFATLVSSSSSNTKKPSSQQQQEVEDETVSLQFTVSADRMAENEKRLLDVFLQRSDRASSERYAKETSHSCSGIAFWPRLFVTPNVVIDSRSYPLGDHTTTTNTKRKSTTSHWQTVLPIGSARPIPNLVGGETILATFRHQLPMTATNKEPPRYSISGTVQ